MADAELLRLIHARRARAPAAGLQSVAVPQTQHATVADASRAALTARAREVLGDKVADAVCAAAAAARAKVADAEARARENVFAIQHAQGSLRREAAARLSLKAAAARVLDGVPQADARLISSAPPRGPPPVSGTAQARAIASFGRVRLSVADLATVLLERAAEDREIERLRAAAAALLAASGRKSA